MTPYDTRSLLAWCGHYDGRPPSKEMLRAWHAALHKDLTLADAKQIVTDHYAKTNYPIRPANINAAFLELRRERLRRCPQHARPQPPSDLDGQDYLIFQNAVVKALGNGASPAAAASYANRELAKSKDTET